MKVSRSSIRLYSFLVVLLLCASLGGIAQSEETSDVVEFEDGLAWVYGHREGPPLLLERVEECVFLNGWRVFPFIVVSQPIPEEFVVPGSEERFEITKIFIDTYRKIRQGGAGDMGAAINSAIAQVDNNPAVESVQVLSIAEHYAWVEVSWVANIFPTKIKLAKDILVKDAVAENEGRVEAAITAFKAWRTILKNGNGLWFTYKRGASRVISFSELPSVDSVLSMSFDDIRALENKPFSYCEEFVWLTRNPLSESYREAGNR